MLYANVERNRGVYIHSVCRILDFKIVPPEYGLKMLMEPFDYKSKYSQYIINHIKTVLETISQKIWQYWYYYVIYILLKKLSNNVQ